MEVTDKEVLKVLDELIIHQRAKCLKIARRINPNMTDDDILNPFDWPEVNENHQFTWEDGQLAGFIAAHAALNAHFADKRRNTSG